MQDCLRWHCEVEQLEGDNQWFCPTCKAHRDATKELGFFKMPHILVVQLKRFSTNEWGQPGPKSNEFISFPVDAPLDLTDLVSGAQPEGAPPVYDLYAVSYHHGTARSGHYTACAKHTATGLWMQYDDARVSKVKASDVCTKDAYVLFYARRTKEKLVEDIVRRQTISHPENWPFLAHPASRRQSTVGVAPVREDQHEKQEIHGRTAALRKYDSY